MDDMEKLRAFYDLAPVAFQSLDKNGLLLWVNEKWLQITGYLRNEVENHDFTDFIAPLDRKNFSEYYIDFKNRGTTENYYLRLLARDGHIIHALFNGKVIFDTQNRFRHSHCSFIDITDQKLAEIKLVERHAQFKQLFAHAKDAILIVNNKNKIIDCNPAFEKMTTCPANELFENSFNDYFIFSKSSKEKFSFKDLSTGRSQKAFGHIKNHHQSLIPVELYAHKINDSLYQIIIHHLTLQELTGSKLNHLKEPFNILTKHDFAWEYWLLPGGDYVYISDGCKRISGYSSDELIADPELFFTRISPEDRDSVRHHYKNENLPDSPAHYREFSITAKNGQTVHIAHQCMPVFDSDGNWLGRRGINRDISAQKALEKRITDERDLAQKYLDIVNSMIVAIDTEGTILMLNRKGGEILGYNPDRLIGKNWLDTIIPKNERPKIKKIISTFKEGGLKSFEQVENYVLTKNGATRLIRWHNTFIRDDKGEIAILLSSGEDITEQKARERLIQESDARYRVLFENITDYVLVIDPSEFPPRIVDCNAMAHQYHGYTRDEFIGLAITDVMDVQNRKLVQQRLEKMYRGETLRFESVHIRKDGSKFNVEIMAKLINLQNKKLIYTIERDITQKKHIENELKTLSVGIQQSPVAVIITNTKGNIEYVNPTFCKDSGYTNSECLNKNPQFIKSGVHDKEFYKDLWDTINAGNWWHGELCNQKKDGSKYWVSATIGPIKNDHGEITKYIGFQNNINKHKILEEEFRQSQKMEAIGRLAGGVAHDFNNLLTVITGYSELTMMKLEKDHPARAAIEQIAGAGKRAETLVSQLLAFSRKQISSPKIVDINQIIKEMEKMLRRILGEDIHFELRLKNSLPLIKIDTGQLEQIIMNLAVNARDAIQSGGHIHITTEVTPVKAGEHLDKAPGDYVSIIVEDDGCGMDAETQKHIFEPFFTTKGKGKGTGLGLATVYGIVEQNDGFIAIKSVPDIGTAFRVSFPTVEKMDIHQTAKPTFNQEGVRGNQTILVVEDEPHTLTFLSDLLKNFGYRIMTAQNGREALDLIRTSPDIDLVFSDVIMPELSGTELRQFIQNEYPQLKVLLMTGYMDDSFQSAALSPEELILKPINPVQLLEKLHSLFQGNPQPG